MILRITNGQPMLRNHYGWILQVALVACCVILPYRGAYAFDSRPQREVLHYVATPAPSQDQHLTDMAAPESGKPADVESLLRFISAYRAGRASQREIFKKHLEPLGGEVILEYLEAIYPYCHSQAHPLGSAIYARTKDLGVALSICRRRCTAGCMHGAVREAFKDQTLGEIRGRLEEFCKGKEMLELYKRGNCAHGLGHAIMTTAGYDLDEALKVCAAFPEKPMGYYCATGAYMEYFAEVQDEEARGRSLHFPCASERPYQAACYRYQARRMLKALSGDVEALAKECLALSGSWRLGCFHGLGVAVKFRVLRNPISLGKFCRHGSLDDQFLCIEGVIEKLADYNQDAALLACATLNETHTQVCFSAAKEKMYRLSKPTLPLYTGLRPK